MSTRSASTRDRFLYTGRKTNEISFPLGGIGTGCIGLAGNGRLIDWEIQNKPNKCNVNGFSHFAIRAESGGKVLDARVLNGDLHPPYTGIVPTNWSGYGFGVQREHMTGLPHFKSVDFRGEFPIAHLAFKGTEFPARVTMTAFNPFIPLNDKDSGIPAAFFEFEIKNTTKKALRYTLAGVLNNPLPKDNVNSVRREGKAHLLYLTSSGQKESEAGYGNLALATDADEVSWQQYWFGASWFDSLEVYIRDLNTPGKFRNREALIEGAGQNRPGLLAAHVTVAPGEKARVRFVISWSFPNCENYWNRGACECAKKVGIPATWKNYYATLWSDSRVSALYALDHWDRLLDETRQFKESLFASTLPAAALDAVSANLAVLKTPTVMRLEDGTFYGWEGGCATIGCCEGSCTHVWNYAQALPFLFPKLERSMREANYKYNLRPDGGLGFRTQLPLGLERAAFRPCGDGQFGDVMKTYRDWKICGDADWLRKLWPAVKKSIEFAWAPTNEDRWDPDKTGVLQGRVHHTLDVELFGPAAWVTGFYLGALKAGSEMAEFLGDHKAAAEFFDLFEQGKAWTDKHLFNGEYYHQKVDLKDKSVVERFDAQDTYWNAEHQELKYQIAEGCEVDQVLAQWHANLYGLGEVFNPRKTKTALKSIFKYNFRPVMRDYANACRIYALNDEAGLVIAHWPDKVYRPMVPLPYAGETQNGYEYAAAIQMIQAGLVKEGMTCIEAIRARYDGEKRNPWNEFECGNNYARSMAAYSLLNTFAGFEFDMAHGMIGFNPIEPRSSLFRCFWSLDSGWGEFEMKSGSIRVRVLYGGLRLSTLRLPFLAKKKVSGVVLNDQPVTYIQQEGEIIFSGSVRIKQGEALKVKF